MIAVIRTGGKQYLVKEDMILRVEKLAGAEEGKSIAFSDVLLLASEDGTTVKLGMSTLEKTQVTAKLQQHGRARKVVVQKFKSKVRYARKYGHRQPFSEVRIEKIALEKI